LASAPRWQTLIGGRHDYASNFNGSNAHSRIDARCGATASLPAVSQAETGYVTVVLTKAGLIVGLSGGRGVLIKNLCPVKLDVDAGTFLTPMNVNSPVRNLEHRLLLRILPRLDHRQGLVGPPEWEHDAIAILPNPIPLDHLAGNIAVYSPLALLRNRFTSSSLSIHDLGSSEVGLVIARHDRHHRTTGTGPANMSVQIIAFTWDFRNVYRNMFDTCDNAI
jgi:hypothetical protein